MEAHDLSVQDVATLLGRAHHTCKVWRTRNVQDIPDHLLELLELKLLARKGAAE